jgi:hypothetical protein
VSVRAFNGFVAVGVQQPAGRGGPARDEVILAAATGRQIRTYPAASYGGAVRADATTTVIVGNSTVTAYANATGRVRWQRGLGATGAPWRASGQYLYVTNPNGAGGVAAVRKISLVTGSERIVRAKSGGFAGSLADVVETPVLDGPAVTVLLFAGASGVSAYGLDGGKPRWQQPTGVVELVDAAQGVVYLAKGAKLTGIAAVSGRTVSSVGISVAASLYWISGGVALGLDQNALGEAWGYSLSARRVAWTSAGLPWPHYFADISGLGGSTSGASDVALVAVCALTGAAPAASAAPPCKRPELAAVLIRAR